MPITSVEDRLRHLEEPTLSELGGADEVFSNSGELALSLYADRIVRALACEREKASREALAFVGTVFSENPHPSVIAAAAYAALGMRIDARDQRLLQRRLLDRALDRVTPRAAEMASECLAAALLFADLPGSSRPAVVAALDDVAPGDQPVLVRRAALLAGLAWLWERSPALEDMLQRLSADEEAGEQAAYELALIHLDKALRSHGRALLLAGLAEAAQLFARAAAAGPELAEAQAFEKILSAVILFCSEDGENLEAQLTQAAEYCSTRSDVDRASLRSWLLPRLDAEVAWWEMALSLRGLSSDLRQRSWLRAAQVLEQIARLRRSLVPLATQQGDELRAVLTETMAASFLRQEGLRSHLTAWIDDAQTSDDDRREALALLQVVGTLAQETVTPAEHRPATDREVIVADVRLAARARALMEAAASPGLTSLTEKVYRAVDTTLASHPDYVGTVRADARVLIEYLTLFLAHCLDVTPHMAQGFLDFLFERDGRKPLEAELQRACWHMLRVQFGGFPPHQVLREVPDIAAGRADIAIIRPVWRMVIEIKRELSDASREGIRRYLGQTATYELTGPRLAFLLVLDLESQRGWPLTLEDNCWVESIKSPQESLSRMVCVWRIPGARQPPSKTPTPIQ